MKRLITILIWTGISQFIGLGQDLYNLKNSLEFANYLYQNGEYKLSAFEYERVIFLDPSNTMARLRLVQSYRKGHEISSAMDRLQDFYWPPNTLPGDFASEYGRLLIIQRHFSGLDFFLENNSFIPSLDKQYYCAVSNMYQANWQAANEVLGAPGLTAPRFMALENTLALANKINYKKPWLSGGMSALVPGTGKIYSGYWKDGLISLLFVGISAWQAYRGVENKGVQSAYGWIYGGVSLGFYLGNIYGSVKAAHKYNHTRNHAIFEKVDNTFYRYE